MRPRFLAGEVWNGLRRSASMAISIVLVSAVSLFFLGVGLLAERQVEAAKGFWYDKVEVSIFLCTARSSEPNCKGGAVSPPQRMVVETLLNSMKPVVKAYEYEDQQTAYQRFREQFKNNPVFADTPADAIPAAFRVQLTDPKDYQQINTAFAGVPGVGAVKDIRQVLEPLFKVLDFLRYAAWGLAGLMLLCTVLLTATTIRQVAFSRRRETAIKRVVGASKASIQLPFMAETLIAALLGAGLAIGSLWASVAYGVRSLSERFRDFAWITTYDVWQVSPVIVVVAVSVAVLVSWLTLIRFVRI